MARGTQKVPSESTRHSCVYNRKERRCNPTALSRGPVKEITAPPYDGIPRNYFVSTAVDLCTY